jgi:hypothetical protein
MVHAEKTVTMLERGEVNTRWRDFADVYLLSTRHGVDGAELETAIQTVAKHRGVTLQPLLPELDGLAVLAQRKWAAWVRKQRLDDRLPHSFEQTLSRVAEFADPASPVTRLVGPGSRVPDSGSHRRRTDSGRPRACP